MLWDLMSPAQSFKPKVFQMGEEKPFLIFLVYVYQRHCNNAFGGSSYASIDN